MRETSDREIYSRGSDVTYSRGTWQYRIRHRFDKSCVISAVHPRVIVVEI